MQVEVNNQDSVLLPLLGHVIFGTDDSCDFILKIDHSPNRKICAIIHDKSVCILEVFNNESVSVNQIPIKEMAIVNAGDIIHIENNALKLINDNLLPKACSAPFKLNKVAGSDSLLLTSVSGLRSFNANNYGELTIVGDQNSFTHKPISSQDIPFSVSYIDDHLTLLSKRNKQVQINGNPANYVVLRNGDFITTSDCKYCVESPGTSSFSKYSPSHPRNIQLSEEYLVEDEADNGSDNNFIKKNLWWLTLVSGLAIIAIILLILKNI